MPAKPKVLICGVLPPPYFGHSMLYEMLMKSSFPRETEINFLNMHFWSYATNKKVTWRKLIQLVVYYSQFLTRLVIFRPRYVLYNSSFYRMPFLKDAVFYITAIVFGKKLIIHDHGQYVRELHDVLPVWQKFILRWVLKHSHASIVMGESVRPLYEGLMAQGKLFVVPGTAEDTRSVSVKSLRAGSEVRVLYFSHLSRDKGVLVAIEALYTVLSGNPQVQMIFGGPLEGPEIEKELRKLQAAFPGRVAYEGYVKETETRTALFRSADIFIFPTLRDVFGLVLLHAMAEGAPIIASSEGTIPEILPCPENGILFNKGDVSALAAHILELAADPLRRQAMGRANRRRFEEEYTVSVFGRRMVDAFRKFDALCLGGERGC